MTPKSREQFERTKEYARVSERGDILFPVAELPGAIFRLKNKSKGVASIIEGFKDGKFNHLPRELMVLDSDNMPCLRLSPHKGEVTKYTGAVRELLRLADRELTMRGEKSAEIAEFANNRKETDRKNSKKVRESLRARVDYSIELAGETSRHQGDSEVNKERYKKIEEYFQNIVDRLFQTSPLKKFKGKIFITKDTRVNAFVLTTDNGHLLKEYLAASESGEDNQKIELPIFVNIGTLEFFESEDEIAAVFSHELSHLIQPDYLNERLEESNKQRLEYDADKNGLHVMNAAGYNPKAMISLFEKMRQSRYQKALDIIFSSSHPNSHNRVIELQKEFHRSDVPLPNAAKKITRIPEDIKSSAQELIKSIKENIVPNFFDGAMDYEKAVLYLKSIPDPSRSLAQFHRSHIEMIGREELDSQLLTQELAHDTLGFRSAFLKELQSFVYGLELVVAHQPTEDLSYSANLNLSSSDIDLNGNGIKLSELDIPKKENYLRPDQTIEKIKINNLAGSKDEHRALENVFKEHDLALPNLDFKDADQLEYWLGDNNQETKRFWDFVADKYSAQITGERPNSLKKEMRLQILKVLLARYIFNDSRSSVAEIKKDTFVVKEETIRKSVEEAGRLSKAWDMLPESIRRGRAAMVRQTREETTVRRRKEGDSRVVTSVSPKQFYFEFNIFEDESVQPFAVRELSKEAKKQTILGYKDILERDGFKGEVDEEKLKFIIETLFDRSKWDIHLSAGRGIKFFDSIIQILEQKSFARFFYGIEPIGQREGGDVNLISDLTLLILAGLKPSNAEEEAIQNKHRNRLEFDPTLRLGFSRSLVIKQKELAEEAVNKKFLKDETQKKDDEEIDGETDVKLKWYYEGDIALKVSLDRLWSQNHQTMLMRIRNVTSNDMSENVSSRLTDYIDSASKDFYFSAISRQGKQLREWLSITLGYFKFIIHEGLPSSKLVKQYFHEKIKYDNEDEIFEEWVEESASILKVSPDLLKKIYSNAIAENQSTEKITTFMLEHTMSGKSVTEVYRDYFGTGYDNKTNTYTIDANQYYPYAPKNKGCVLLESKTNIQEVLEFLKEQKFLNPKLESLFLKLEEYKSAGIELPEELKAACYGHLPKFALVKGMPAAELIKFWTVLDSAYGDEWKGFEQYKRYEEQMSLWEWLYNNSLCQELVEDVSITSTSRGLLARYYTVDTTNINGVTFSWPLLLEDLWGGTFDPEAIESRSRITLEQSQRENWVKPAEDLIKEIKRIVDDPNNWEQIVAMQPGFFREFILDKKIKKMEEKQGRPFTLKEIEGYLPLFSQHTHEVSTRNQINAQVENVRYEIADEVKKRILDQVISQKITRDALKDSGAAEEGEEFEKLSQVTDKDFIEFISNTGSRSSPDDYFQYELGQLPHNHQIYFLRIGLDKNNTIRWSGLSRHQMALFKI